MDLMDRVPFSDNMHVRSFPLAGGDTGCTMPTKLRGELGGRAQLSCKRRSNEAGVISPEGLGI